MPKFVTKNIVAIKGRQQFRQLVVLSDETVLANINSEEQNGQLDIYEANLETKYSASFNRIIAIMNQVANLQGLPDTQWRDVTPANEIVKEYEVKAGDLRVFLIKIPNGKLVILGGYKNQQRHDFIKFRSLKKQYIEYLKLTDNDQRRITKK